jgi:integrase
VLSGERRPDRYYALAALVLAVGLRQAEALDLRWEAVDLDAATLEVVDAKTPAGFRTIPIPAFVVEALREHRTVQTLDRMVADAWEDDGLVFTTTIGSRIDARNALRWWHGLTTRAGVGRRRFHCSRHTAGTVMLNRGVPLVIVSQILGHARVDITAKIYARPYVETLRAGADAIDRAYSPPRR